MSAKPSKQQYRKLWDDIQKAKPVVNAPNELWQLCRQLILHGTEPSSVCGEHWCVDVFPELQEIDSKRMDVMIHIHPITEEVENAAYGVRLWLESEKESGSVFLLGAPTNRFGQTWFHQVEPDCYRLGFNRSKVLSSSLDTNKLKDGLAADSPNDKRFKIIELQEKAIRVHLGKLVTDGAMLTVSSEDPRFEQAVVHFDFGKDTGEIELQQTEGSIYNLRGQCKLTQSFADAYPACLPDSFEIQTHPHESNP
jgi:hypothetical protein